MKKEGRDENFKNESKGNDNGIEGKFKLGY